MDLEVLIQNYALSKGLEVPKFNQEGIVRLLFDQKLLLNFEKNPRDSSFYLYATLGTVQSEEEKSVFFEVLSGNLFGSQTGKASFGIVPDSHLLVLFEYFDERACEQETFDQEIERFCQYLVFWTQKLSSLRENLKPIPLQTQLRGLERPGQMKIFFA